jgi:hypothetical protein
MATPAKAAAKKIVFSLSMFHSLRV